MRPVRALGIYIAIIFIGGALIAPLLFWFVQSFGTAFPHLANSPFHRYLTRAFLILAIAGLWPLFKSLGAKSWSDLGIVKPSSHWKMLAAGFMLGFVSLALVALSSIAAGARSPVANHSHLAQKLITALLSAVVVGALEEILFRGGIFGALRKNMSWKAALVISSSIYALVHFLGSPRDNGPVLWYSGLALLPGMLEGFFHFNQLIPGFFNLTLAGALLALAYQRTGNLYFSIGLHSGWIFWLKSNGVLTREVPHANVWLWGGNKLIDGWFALLVLSATLLCVACLLRPSNSASNN